ncbi:MAG: hypothetical protein WAV23_02235 [Minisyncoccia bacterium]
MKKLIMVLICSFTAVVAHSQVEIFGRYTLDGKVEPDINIFGTKKISEKFNLTYFALIEEQWSEGLIGFSYAPKSWLELGLSAGVEHNPAILRFGGSIWIGKGKTSLLILGEQGSGKDNYWYKTVLAYKTSDHLTLGAIAWRFHGVGPIVSYTPKKSNVTIWLSPAYDIESKAKRLIAGLAIKI